MPEGQRREHETRTRRFDDERLDLRLGPRIPPRPQVQRDRIRPPGRDLGLTPTALLPGTAVARHQRLVPVRPREKRSLPPRNGNDPDLEPFANCQRHLFAVRVVHDVAGADATDVVAFQELRLEQAMREDEVACRRAQRDRDRLGSQPVAETEPTRLFGPAQERDPAHRAGARRDARAVAEFGDVQVPERR
jgi:hypothetical protein